MIVLDLDGTLYNQLLMRFFMILEIASHMLIPSSYISIKVVHTFRKEREFLGKTLAVYNSNEHIASIGKAYNLSQERVSEIIRQWIEKKPLK